MKKFLSIKQVTNTLSISDLQLYKKALESEEHRINFLIVIFEILENTTNQEECESLKNLLDQMVEKLYQKSVVRKTILSKINYAESHYLNGNTTSETHQEPA